MKKGLKYLLLAGSFVAGITLYNINSASAYSQGAYHHANYNVPAQTVQAADDQSAELDSSTQQPYGQYVPNPYMTEPGYGHHGICCW